MTLGTFPVSDVRKLLRKACEEAGSQKAWADQHSVSEAYVSDVLKSRREPGEAILDGLGIDKVVSYRWAAA